MKKQPSAERKYKEEELEEYMNSHKKRMIDSLWKLNMADIKATHSRVCQMAVYSNPFFFSLFNISMVLTYVFVFQVLQDPTVKKKELRAGAKGLRTLGQIFQKVKSASETESEPILHFGVHNLNGVYQDHSSRGVEPKQSSQTTMAPQVGGLRRRYEKMVCAPSIYVRGKNMKNKGKVGSPGSVYRPEWGVTNGSLLDTPKACQDLVDHAAPPGNFFELRRVHNEDFLGQYNINVARQVAMGSQLRLRFEQEAKLLRKSVAQVARRDQRIQARESEIKNLEALLKAEAGMKRAAEEKSAGLSQELERMQSLEAYDLEAEAKFAAALQSLKDLKYPLLDQLEGLRDALMDVIMASLYLEDDTREDAPQFIHDLRPSSSQLTIPVYPEKKRSRIVCRTHGVGSAHHVRSDRVPVSAPIVVPHGLALLLVDAATQT
nr:DnaJ heat shock N-terminal domain-containing protein [Tanacetum cinerariifolium]